MKQEVLPGRRVGAALSYGPGVHQSDGVAYATIAGRVVDTDGQISVERHNRPANGSAGLAEVPKSGDVVVAKVQRVTRGLGAMVDILLLNGDPIVMTFRGQLRLTDLPFADQNEAVRPGDIVMGLVLSTGDSRGILISISDVCHGVIYAKSEIGAIMVPASWKRMKCTKT
eukprot:Trichotokara_eunicae@DN5210_c0_g2_i3.p1